MESDQTPEQRPLDFENLTDEELFELLPVKEKKRLPRNKIQTRYLKPEERSALEELWRRYWPKTKEYLRARIYASGSTLCPPEEPDKGHFCVTCFDETELVFFRRTCRKQYEKFGAFLFTMALNVTLDIRKHLTGTEEGPTIIHDEDVTKDLEDTGRDPHQTFAARQLRDLFEEYAAISPRNALSMKIAYLKRGQDMTWEKILELTEKNCPGKAIGPTIGARIKKLRDFEKHDTKKLLQWFQDRKITDAGIV